MNRIRPSTVIHLAFSWERASASSSSPNNRFPTNTQIHNYFFWNIFHPPFHLIPFLGELLLFHFPPSIPFHFKYTKSYEINLEPKLIRANSYTDKLCWAKSYTNKLCWAKSYTDKLHWSQIIHNNYVKKFELLELYIKEAMLGKMLYN